MSRARVLQEVRIMKFEEIYERWTESRLTQAQTAEILGVCERQFRRQCRRYDEDGIEGLIDKRLGEVSGRRAQFAQAMERLGIQMIAAYSPQARGRAEAKRRGVPGATLHVDRFGYPDRAAGGWNGTLLCLGQGAIETLCFDEAVAARGIRQAFRSSARGRPKLAHSSPPSPPQCCPNAGRIRAVSREARRKSRPARRRVGPKATSSASGSRSNFGMRCRLGTS